MIHIVLDTNILISALLSPQGAPARVLLMALAEPDLQLCVSGAIYAEYDDVIRRPRFRRSDDEIDSALRAIRKQGFWVRTATRVQACSDPSDNIFL